MVKQYWSTIKKARRLPGFFVLLESLILAASKLARYIQHEVIPWATSEGVGLESAITARRNHSLKRHARKARRNKYWGWRRETQSLASNAKGMNGSWVGINPGLIFGARRGHCRTNGGPCRVHYCRRRCKRGGGGRFGLDGWSGLGCRHRWAGQGRFLSHHKSGQGPKRQQGEFLLDHDLGFLSVLEQHR